MVPILDSPQALYTAMAMTTAAGKPLLITVAPNGTRREKGEHASLPLAAREIGFTAAACRDAGAGMIHLHVRDELGAHSLAPHLYRVALREIRHLAGTELFVQVTTESCCVRCFAADGGAAQPECGSGLVCPQRVLRGRRRGRHRGRILRVDHRTRRGLGASASSAVPNSRSPSARLRWMAMSASASRTIWWRPMAVPWLPMRPAWHRSRRWPRSRAVRS